MVELTVNQKLDALNEAANILRPLIDKARLLDQIKKLEA